ncbi:MAG: ATP-dependent metallopeptidase FtsH/Yme1/Tma family protein, partial [Smithellaceae bacterium]|nr:ATP-dependent metallopeptidase FtsH/Yme1/Tma family protein [Smithellaceae bacterium]
MNSLQKNIALWLVISLVFVLLYHLFTEPKSTQQSIIYSDFLTDVDQGKIAEAQIQGDNITGKLPDGKQ